MQGWGEQVISYLFFLEACVCQPSTLPLSYKPSPRDSLKRQEAIQTSSSVVWLESHLPGG